METDNIKEAQKICDLPPPNTLIIKPEKPAFNGVGLVNNFKMRIINADLVPREYCIPDEKALTALAKSSQGKAIVPGVEFYNDQAVRQR